MTERAWIDTSGNERLRGTIEPEPGSFSLPTNVDWNENDLSIHEASDSGPLTPILFRLKTLLSGGLQLSVRVAAFFASDLTTYNDNGNELFESDSLANGGDGEVRIGGVAVVPGTSFFPVSLADGEDVQFFSETDPTTLIVISNTGGHLYMRFEDAGVDSLEFTTTGSMLVFGNPVYVLESEPELPASPTVQDIADALVSLNLVTQAA